MLRINGIGCCLLDEVYGGFDPASDEIKPLLGKIPGDGGLIEGGLVFFEDLGRFSDMELDHLHQILTGGHPALATNLGGPAVVAMVHVAQMLEGLDARVTFDGVVADDEAGQRIRQVISKTPLIDRLRTVKEGRTPTTMVLTGRDERSFVNDIGVAAKMTASDIPEDFYDADIVLAGGTALLPALQSDLASILRKAKDRGCLTVVGTVYDFISQKRDPGSRWPLVADEDWNVIDLLVMDAEEALRLSGTADLQDAARFFEHSGVGAFIITHGKKETLLWAGKGRFASHKLVAMPVNKKADEMMAADPTLRKDTVGCGDNFAGGVISSLAMQLLKDKSQALDIIDACAWGSASGGFTCMYAGGTYIEQYPGEKASHVRPLVESYYEQLEASR